MFLARRELGKQLRVYELRGTQESPRAWPFYGDRTDELGFKVLTKATVRAKSRSGICATGHTRSGAMENLSMAEAGDIDALYVFPEVENA